MLWCLCSTASATGSAALIVILLSSLLTDFSPQACQGPSLGDTALLVLLENSPPVPASSIAVANCHTCRLATAQSSGQKCDTSFPRVRSRCWENVSPSKALGEEYLFSLPFQKQKLPSSLVSGPLFITSQHRQVKAFLHGIALTSSATSVIYFEGPAFLQSVWCYSNGEPCGWVIYRGHAFI